MPYGSVISEAGEYEHHRQLPGAGGGGGAPGIPEDPQVGALSAVGVGCPAADMPVYPGERPEPDSQRRAIAPGNHLYVYGRTSDSKRGGGSGPGGESGAGAVPDSCSGSQRQSHPDLVVCAVPALGCGCGGDGVVCPVQLPYAAAADGHGVSRAAGDQMQRTGEFSLRAGAAAPNDLPSGSHGAGRPGLCNCS